MLLQANVIDTMNGIDLTEAGASPDILRDLSKHTILAFLAALDAPQAHKRSAGPSITAQAPDSMTMMLQRNRITYIALAKMGMPNLAKLFLRFKVKPVKDEIFVNRTIDSEALLSTYAVPTKLRYDCPPPSQLGNNPPLWETDDVLLQGRGEDLWNNLHIFYHCDVIYRAESEKRS